MQNLIYPLALHFITCFVELHKNKMRDKKKAYKENKVTGNNYNIKYVFCVGTNVFKRVTF